MIIHRYKNKGILLNILSSTWKNEKKIIKNQGTLVGAWFFKSFFIVSYSYYYTYNIWLNVNLYRDLKYTSEIVLK